MSQPAGSKIEKGAAGQELQVLNVVIPAGAEMPTHHTTSEAILFTRKGKATLTINGKQHELTAGSSFVLPSGADHSLKVHEDFEAQVVLKDQSKIEFKN